MNHEPWTWLDSWTRNIPGSYAVLLFTASDFTSITSHIHNWVLFLLWLHLFILSGVISPLISSSILGTYQPGAFIFQCPIFLPFHTVHGILKARILKWFAIPFSSRPHFVRTLHHDHLGWPYTKWPGVSNEPENEGHIPLWSFGLHICCPLETTTRTLVVWWNQYSHFLGELASELHSPPL